MTPNIPELVHYARDQLRVQPNWHGENYVERCLQLWAEKWGTAVAAKVRAALKLPAS